MTRKRQRSPSSSSEPDRNSWRGDDSASVLQSDSEREAVQPILSCRSPSLSQCLQIESHENSESEDNSEAEREVVQSIISCRSQSLSNSTRSEIRNSTTPEDFVPSPNTVLQATSSTSSESTYLFYPSLTATVDLQTFDEKSMPATATDNGNIATGQYILRQNNVYIEDIDGRSRGAQLIRKAVKIVKGARHSTMQTETAEELLRKARKHKTDNEWTFLVNVWGILLNESRWVGADETTDREVAIAWIEKAWEKDHLKCNWGADFISDAIPPLIFGDAKLEEAAGNIPKFKIPRPDLTYGLEEKAFTEVEQRINFANDARLSVNLDHPFLGVEGKGSSSPIAEAELQCARAGTCMVHLKRKFNKLATKTPEKVEKVKNKSHPPLGPASAGSYSETVTLEPSYAADEDSFVFTLAIAPSKAHLFVNWAEEKDFHTGKVPGVYYHMHLIESFDLEKAAQWAELHHDIDNVLDWGVGKRKRDLSNICEKSLANSSTKSNKRPRTS